MHYLACIFIMILNGCKNESNATTETSVKTQTVAETESENAIDPSVAGMWQDYIASNPKFEGQEIPESDFFHNNRADANRLAELTLNGKKKASSGLYSLYKYYQVALPKVGTKQIVTDFDGKAVAIIENKRVDTIPFNQISEDYAGLDMGTDVEPLEKWKKAHWDFFENFLKESGGEPNEEMLIVCVIFKTVWPAKH
ncbi:ASCH domain-containing protein [Aggregatimonas sangjinii]|uniref:ASCH domain-containing protein n=1 Tax=Aggregatimonas sangjinii TaxID=2583587 RepID=A0A5B7SMC8_9FLAO|nr:ASCH domain-containing protein [Aggregatimonas sangjinii]QCW99824.1 ASCH domain-containing protein [Aggregatimonas sangjinii]